MKSNLKKFKILNKIGQGSFGNIYKVLRNADNKIYALKEISLDNDNSKYLDEIEILASIDNDYVL